MEREDDIKNRKGLWSEEEDRVLVEHIKVHGIGQWNRIPNLTGLKRCGKSCRLRWLNYLSPNVKRGSFSDEEDDLIIRLHKLLGNRWSLIAGRVPGRTDNQVKNHWNTHLSKKLGIINSGRIMKKQSKLVSRRVQKSPNSMGRVIIKEKIQRQGIRDNDVARREDEPVQGESGFAERGADIFPELPANIFSDRDFFYSNHDDGVINLEFLDLDVVLDGQMYWQCF